MSEVESTLSGKIDTIDFSPVENKVDSVLTELSEVETNVNVKLDDYNNNLSTLNTGLNNLADMYSNIALNSAIIMTQEEFNAALNDLNSQLI